MAHSHAHHYPDPSASNLGNAFLAGIILNVAFVIIEFIGGFYTNSLALLSDAGHNLSDVATLALSLFAFHIARRKATSRYTYGFHRGTILASLANAVILLLAAGSIGWEAIQRFIHPVQTQGKFISIIASIGIIINTASALLFFRNKDTDLNAKSAYLHLALDAVVSLGVVISGLIIYYTHLPWIDPFIGLVIMAVVIYSTWGLLTESLRLSLDAVPQGIDVENIKQVILKTSGVKSVFHIHIWAMGTTKNAMTAHIQLEESISGPEVETLKNKLRHELLHLDIQHVTLETESSFTEDKTCKD
jgi:cobalt-zinc-cadmium efflux system protein